MKLYIGISHAGLSNVLIADLGPAPSPRPLLPRPDLVRGQVGGYLWGTRAPGCLLTAVSLLAELTGSDEVAIKYGPSFAEQIIERLRGDAWIMTAEQLLFGLVGAQQQVYAAEKHIPGLTVETSTINSPDPPNFEAAMQP